MAQTERMLQAARALSQALSASSVRHAFHGSVVVAMMSNAALCDVGALIVLGSHCTDVRLVQEIFCIVAATPSHIMWVFFQLEDSRRAWWQLWGCVTCSGWVGRSVPISRVIVHLWFNWLCYMSCEVAVLCLQLLKPCFLQALLHAKSLEVILGPQC